MVHGNICPENVLINDFKAAVLSDFDLSRAIEEKTGFTTTGAGGQANRYLAPEAFTADWPSSATFPTDIYAFGGLILTVRGIISTKQTLSSSKLISINLGDERAAAPSSYSRRWKIPSGCDGRCGPYSARPPGATGGRLTLELDEHLLGVWAKRPSVD